MSLHLLPAWAEPVAILFSINDVLMNISKLFNKIINPKKNGMRMETRIKNSKTKWVWNTVGSGLKQTHFIEQENHIYGADVFPPTTR